LHAPSDRADWGWSAWLLSQVKRFEVRIGGIGRVPTTSDNRT
jgi:hypothetical protein